MKVRELAVAGAWEITPQPHADSRGVFFEWFTDPGFTAMTGHRFDLRQANCSVSSAGVLRGLHFAQLPPSQAKYLVCPHGAVFDVVADIRVGSPTFGQWDSVLLDDRDRRSVYISEGLAHGFLALQDDSTVMYLCSAGYNPTREHTILRHRPGAGHRVAGHRRRRADPVRARRRGAHARRGASGWPAADVGGHPHVRRTIAPPTPGGLSDVAPALANPAHEILGYPSILISCRGTSS